MTKREKLILRHLFSQLDFYNKEIAKVLESPTHYSNSSLISFIEGQVSAIKLSIRSTQFQLYDSIMDATRAFELSVGDPIGGGVCNS